MTSNTNHTIGALVQDKPGVLDRVASMFRRRGFNIVSLAVGHSEHDGLSRMTFVVEGNEDTVEQVTKQLNRLIDVLKVTELDEQEIVVRELVLIKVRTTPATRSDIIQIASIFRANIVDVGPNALVVEATGEEKKIDALNHLFRPFGVLELMRTGRVAMMRGAAEGMAARTKAKTSTGALPNPEESIL